MSTSDGQVTNAVYGFTSMLAIVLASRPEFAAAAFDLAAPTFRSKEYEEYKAGRRAMPDDLRPQIEKVREVLEAFSIPIYGVEGFEADDVIGTLARIAEERGHAVTIVSGDLDCLQLVTESVEALVPRRGITDTFVYGPDQVRQRPTLAFQPALRSGGWKSGEARPEAPRLAPGATDVGASPSAGPAGRGARRCGVGVATARDTFYVSGAEAMDAVASSLTEGLPISGHDAKETELALRALGGGTREWAFSTYLAAYLLGAGSRDPRLEDLAREFLDMTLISTEQLLGTGRSARKPADVPVEEAAEFAARRAEAILNLRPRLEAEMRNLGVDYLFHEIELPLSRVLADMESEGVAIDVPYLKQMQEELGEQLTAIESEVEQVAGQKFNLSAPQQLAKVLFEDLRLPVGKRTKTGYSTDADTLEALREKHPIVGLILEHRQLSKLKSTYVDALPQLVDPLTGRVHTSFGQASTATGRLSSSNPNLMNIPIRTELGQRIRRAFKASRPGHVMVSADYAQIELRIAAHLSGDPELLGAFQAGQDIHTATAAAVFKIPIESVDPNQRRLAKIANFGSIYGQGEYGLSQQLGITGDVAREFLGQYWSTYSRLREYLDDVKRKARREGFQVSPTGRRRAIPDLRSPNFQLRGAAERMAINFPMQSLAADIIKIAMVRLQREIKADHIEGRILLQVHDELLFEVPRSELDQFAEKVPRIMTGAYELETGIEVEMKVGPNWADMKKLAVVRA